MYSESLNHSKQEGNMIRFAFLNCQERDFPDGSVVKNLPHNAGDMGLTPGSGTKTLHAAEQLSHKY